jgi:hypothetical protein
MEGACEQAKMALNGLEKAVRAAAIGTGPSSMSEHAGALDMCRSPSMPWVDECHLVWMLLDQIISSGNPCTGMERNHECLK